MKTLVLGLGNPILTDDGVGVRVAEAVGSALRGEEAQQYRGATGEAMGGVLPPIASGNLQELDVVVQEVSIGGLTLMETMLGFDRVILIDALERPDVLPGALLRLTLPDLERISPTQHSASPHDVNLVTAFELGRRMGLPLPTSVIIYAIGVENVLDFGDQPTPAVAAAIPTAAAAVLQELQRS